MLNKAFTYFGTLVLLFIIVGSPTTCQAQDPHFSQFYASPLTINPALAGTGSGTYRLSTIYRDQWRSALESPLTTFAFAGDLKFGLDAGRNEMGDVVALGLNFFADRVAGFDLNTTTMALTSAYHKLLNPKKKTYLGGGFQIGVLQKSINYEDLTFQDEFNTLDGYTLATSETLPANNFAVADMSVGLNLSGEPSNRVRYNIGVAMYHFAQPNISFYKSSNDPDPQLQKENKLYSRLVFNASTELQMSEQFSISPRLLILSQGPHTEINLGNNFRFEFYEKDYMALHFGAWLRAVDNTSGFGLESFVFMAGMEYNRFVIGFSYDLGLGDVLDSRLGLTSYEFSVTYTGQHDNDSAFCPVF